MRSAALAVALTSLATSTLVAAGAVNEFGHTVGASGVKPARPRQDVPNRLSVEKSNPFYNAADIKRIGVRFDGEIRKADVVEYNVAEGWIKVHVLDGKTGAKKIKVDGTYLTRTIKGLVEPFWRVPAPEVFAEIPVLPKEHYLDKAAAKRERKALKLAAEVQRRAGA